MDKLYTKNWKHQKEVKEDLGKEKGFLHGSMVKNLSGFHPWVGKISQEEGMATHSSILAWEIPWTEETGGLQSTGSQTKQCNSILTEPWKFRLKNLNNKDA